jgi:hypothetical protein
MILVSSVIIVTRLQAGWSRSIFFMPRSGQNLTPRSMQTCSAVNHSVPGVLIAALRRRERKADHSIPPNAEVKNECNSPHASTFWPEKELLILQFQCHNFQNPTSCVRSLIGSLCKVTQRLFFHFRVWSHHILFKMENGCSGLTDSVKIIRIFLFVTLGEP